MDTITLLYIILGTVWCGIWTVLGIGVYTGRYKSHE